MTFAFLFSYHFFLPGVQVIMRDTLIKLKINEKYWVSKNTLKTMSNHKYRKSWSWSDCTNHRERLKPKLYVKLQMGWRGKQKENAWQIHMKCPRQLLSAQKWFYGIHCGKKGTKKLSSWVQKIKLHFHWSQTCKSCPINHSCLKIPINGLKCWGRPYGSSL